MLAERLGRLRLVKTTVADRVGFIVEDGPDDGVIADSASYAENDFFAAIDDFDRRALGLFEPEVAAAASVMIEMINAVGGHDAKSLEILLAEDFRLVDHRPIGLPDMDRASLIAASSLFDDEAEARYLSRTVHAVNESGAVVTGGFWRNHLGEWTEYFASTVISLVESDLVTLNELFPEDQLELALARFAEVSRSPSNGE